MSKTQYPTNKLERELWKETLYKRVIMNTNSIRYLKGIASGMRRREDISRIEKRYYLTLIRDKIDILTYHPKRIKG